MNRQVRREAFETNEKWVTKNSISEELSNFLINERMIKFDWSKPELAQIGAAFDAMERLIRYVRSSIKKKKEVKNERGSIKD